MAQLIIDTPSKQTGKSLLTRKEWREEWNKTKAVFASAITDEEELREATATEMYGKYYTEDTIG